METYVIVRRNGWRTAGEFEDATRRSAAEAERMAADVAWLRSYLLEERDGSAGSVCIYRATSPEAVRAHARAAGLPVDEIVKVADTVRMRAAPARRQSGRRGVT